MINKDFSKFLYNDLSLLDFLGLIIFGLGIGLTILCIVNFIKFGQGTISPIEPTRKLVISSVYRYSRNPMYVGVLNILIGEIIFTQSMSLFLYSCFIFGCFHLFIILREEPRLIKDFGVEYEKYKRTVRRWM